MKAGLLSRLWVCLAVLALAACAGNRQPKSLITPEPAPLPTANTLDELVAAAQAEGELVTMALPNDWCNYGEVLRSFQEQYGIEVQVLDPHGSSGDELDAVRAYRDTGQGEAPDTVDIGYAFGPQAQEEGLIVPYQVATWASIPAAFKQPQGYWYGGYYGILSFEVNTSLVPNPPQDWQDLHRPEYRGQVALAGDPRSSNQAIMSVYAAALANGGSLDNALPGLYFFKAIHSAGNLAPVIANVEQIASGETPIVIRWDYLALGDRDALADQVELKVILPRSGLLGGLYVQAISAYARHPNAARLWMEYLYSDKGQILWLKGYCHPIRFDDLVARQMIPQNLMGLLPPAELYNQAHFPSLEQQNAAKAVITGQWNDVVEVDIVRP